MDALEILKQMHVEATAAFEQIDAADAGGRGALWAELQPKLELHEQIEERFVYDPVAREAGPSDPTLAGWEQEHELQVQDADAAMARIDGLDPEGDAWIEAVDSLAATLSRHIEHEENDIWPRIRRAWGDDRLAEAGRLVDAAKTAAEAGTPVQEAVDGAQDGAM